MRTLNSGFRGTLSIVIAAGTLALGAGAASAQVDDGPYTIDLRTVASGLVAPVQIKPSGDGSGRRFIVDQAGLIRILMPDGTLLPTPFLDVRPIMVAVNPGYDERGLLGVAFHPDYAKNGRFFVHYTIPRQGQAGVDPCFGTSRGCSSEVLAEYTVSADPNVANAASGMVLLTVEKPQFNHAGGFMDFGPDGYLYYALGDGGGANDGLADNPPSHGPIGNGQNTATALGKILRYDVSTPGTLAIPPTNPFFGQMDKFQGIYAYGLRHPYSGSFDDGPGGTGRLFIADVGQNLFEEIDIIENGGNYGWVIKEGFHCFDPFNPNTPPASCPAGDSTLPPIVEYGRTVGIAAISGKVYRGSGFPGLRGLYLFGDFSTSFGTPNGHLFYLDPSTATPTMFRLKLGADNHALGLYLKGMGVDQDHEQYILASSVLGPSGTGGVVMKIAPCRADYNGDGLVDASDTSQFLEDWNGAKGTLPDINGDGFVDGIDYDLFFNAFAAGC